VTGSFASYEIIPR